MANYKYPYIADKKLYAAVMGACSYIRETGYFNKAVSYYADKYGLDEEAVAAEVRKRQAAGQKKRTPPNKGKKMRYFIVAEVVTTEEGGNINYVNPCIKRAYSAESLLNKYYDSDLRNTIGNDTGGIYSLDFSHEVIGDQNGYDTQEQAEQAFRSAWVKVKRGER